MILHILNGHYFLLIFSNSSYSSVMKLSSRVSKKSPNRLLHSFGGFDICLMYILEFRFPMEYQLGERLVNVVLTAQFSQLGLNSGRGKSG